MNSNRATCSSVATRCPGLNGAPARPSATKAPNPDRMVGHVTTKKTLSRTNRATLALASIHSGRTGAHVRKLAAEEFIRVSENIPAEPGTSLAAILFFRNLKHVVSKVDGRFGQIGRNVHRLVLVDNAFAPDSTSAQRNGIGSRNHAARKENGSTGLPGPLALPRALAENKFDTVPINARLRWMWSLCHVET